MQPSSFREVVSLWPSRQELASELGVHPEAVRKWSERNSIPAEWWLPILRTPRAEGAGLTADAFAGFVARESAA